MKHRLLVRFFLMKKYCKDYNRLECKHSNIFINDVKRVFMCGLKTDKTDNRITNLGCLIKNIFWENIILKNSKFLDNLCDKIENESINKLFVPTFDINGSQSILPCCGVEFIEAVSPVKEIKVENSNAAELLQEKEIDSRENVEPNSNKYTFRSHTCGELNCSHIGKKVQLFGWVQFFRNDKFILIRDGYGITQLVISDERQDLQTYCKGLSFESVICVEGIVERRPPGQENPKLFTGEIEILITNLKILNKAKVLPFTVRDFNIPNEITRMKYRYLDLRHKFMQSNLRFRSKMIHKIRCFLIEKLNFVEVETPTLFKRTPGGAQEFIVPTSKKDKFFALVQSPQQFKQLLMIGSIDRYFQIARCYRDEQGELDRQPEFTQLDLEMSFCERSDVLNLIEDLLKHCWPKHLPSLTTPFQKMSYDEALNNYGTDKPDLRFDWKLKNLRDIFIKEKENCKGKYKVSELINEKNFSVFAFVGRQGEAVFSKKLKNTILEEISLLYSNVKLLFFPVKKMEKVKQSLTDLFCASIALSIEEITRFDEGDVLFVALGTKDNVQKCLGKIRLSFAQYLEQNQIEVIEKNTFKFLWILDFPMFEKSNDDIESTHHPFTQPHPDDISLLESDPLKARSLHYDLVLNGKEIGGGSIRIHDFKLQKMILENILKINTESLSHLLEGLASGAPPHGGIALGLDRFIAILCGTSSIRNVIAFPKGTLGNDPMSEAPCEISKQDKERYHLN